MGFSTLSSVNCNYCAVGLGWKSSSLFPHLNSFPKIISYGVLLPHKKSYKLIFPRASASSSDPLLVKAARGEPVNRPPAWMMRQAGRYMAVYRKLAEKHPSFRERSETIDLIVQISLQPWEAFHPDGVIIFSDILTPLPAFGIPFDIEEIRGPVIQSPIRTQEDLKALHPIDLEKLQFVGDSLRILRNEVGNQAAVLGFVGAPWTIATYIVEGGTTRTYTTIKSMCHKEPHLLRALLSHLAKAIAEYIIFQVESGAHCVQIFDSWGGQLPPVMWDQWSKPYIEEIVRVVKEKCPQTPLVLYINGNGGFLERMKTTGVDVIGLDWTVDMADGRKRLGTDISIQGNVDPAYLFSPLPALTNEIKRVVKCAGTKGHILNLGHGVLVGTPEEAVAHFFDVARSLKFDTQVEKNDAVGVGHDVDHFTNPEGVPGVPETNFNNRTNSFKVLSPPRTCVVYYRVEEDLNGVKENDESSSCNDADASEMLHDVNNLREESYSAEKKKDG